MSSISEPPKKKTKTTDSAELALPTSKEWKTSDCETLMYLYPPSTLYSEKIAGFDIDGTVIQTKSGKNFATDDLTDWKLWSNNVKEEFGKLVSDEYRIVFFTNQEGISKGKVNKCKWMKQIENVVKKLDLTDKVTVLVSLTKKGNDYRKPHTGMWRFLSKFLSGSDGISPDLSESFYVGDAAGRPKRGIMKKDFSCSDYKFALNVGFGRFMTPEQFYYKSKKPSDLASLKTSNMGFQPKSHWKSYIDWPLDKMDPTMETIVESCAVNNKEKKHEIIVIVGSPASGKSSATAQILEAQQAKLGSSEYIRVNQDTLKTVAKCIKVTKEAMADGNSVIVDNTNRDIKTRKEYITIAKEQGVPCRCVWVKTTKEESFHLNALRGAVGVNANGDEKRSVPDVSIHSFYKNIAEPKVAEGFKEVLEVPFVPGPFPTDERRESFYMFTH